jgi:selenocysteine lyase/cysteine desulfurase
VLSANSIGDAVTQSRREIGRRDLLRAGALAAPALTILSPAPAAAEPGSGFNPGNWNSVRSQFLLTRRHAHFSAFMLAAHPAPVRRAIADFRDTLDSFPEQYHMGVADIELSAEVRASVARFIGATPEEVALTDSATMGIGLVYRGLALPRGAEVITTPHEFYSTYEALRTRAASDAVTVREVALYTDPATASIDEIVGRLRTHITDRTRIIALTWVHSSTGVKLPIRQIADLVASVNTSRDEQDHILLCVDGVHGFGVEDVDLPALGADMVMTSTHKWLFGPRGTGFVWGTSAAWRRMRPTIPSFSLPAFIGWLSGRPPEGPPGELNSPGGYHSFEHRWALRSAIEFNEAIGRSRIANRTSTQVSQLKRGLAELKHIRLVTPSSPELSSGIVCCDVAGMSAEQVAGKLLDDYRIAAGTTPYRTSYLRFGPSIVTDPAEVTRLVNAMSAIR